LTDGLVLNGVDLADPNAPLPERVGPFSLHARLGRSKSGVVLEATTDQGVRVAIKLARPPLEAAERREETARLLRELSVLKALSHPGVIRLVDAGLVGGLLYMAVERVEGVTLRSLIGEGSADFDVVAAIGLQVGSTIAHLHTVGVLQREITPDVIIAQSNGRLLLADFGFSTFIGAPVITEPGPPQGTLGYIAPELFDTGKSTHASDQYALGRLLFELCAPAQRSSIQASHATPAERQSAGWIDWAGFPLGAYHRSLKPVLEKMLAVEPKARYPDVYTAVAEIATLTAYKGLVDAGLVGGRGRSSSPKMRSTSGANAFAAFVDHVHQIQEEDHRGALRRTISDSFSDVGAPFYATSYLLIEPAELDRDAVLQKVCREAERYFAERDANRVADQLRDDARTFWEDRAKKSGWTEEVTPLDPDPDAATAPGGEGGTDTIFDALRTDMISGDTTDEGSDALPRISSDHLLPPPEDAFGEDPPNFLPVPASVSGSTSARNPLEEVEEQMHADTVSEALVIPQEDFELSDPADEPARLPSIYSMESLEEKPVAVRPKLDLPQLLVAAALLLVGLLLGFFLGRG
jgi:eukaryotic-like serine/threonine-protein kinase